MATLPIKASFVNNGQLKSGLTPLVYLYDHTDTAVVNGETATELASDYYTYSYSGFNPLASYYGHVDSQDGDIAPLHWNGLDDFVAQIPPRGLASAPGTTEKVSISQKELDKMRGAFEEAVTELFASVELKVDTLSTQQEISNLEDASSAVLDKIQASHEQMMADFQEKLAQMDDKRELDLSSIEEAEGRMVSALQGVQDSMMNDMTQFGQVLATAIKAQQSGMDQHVEDMTALANSLKIALEMNEERTAKIKQALKILENS